MLDFKSKSRLYQYVLLLSVLTPLNVIFTNFISQFSWSELGSIVYGGFSCKNAGGTADFVILHRDPLVVLINNFLNPGEAEYIQTISREIMQSSYVFDINTGEKKLDHSRTSKTAKLNFHDEDPVVQAIQRHASGITGIPLDQTEPLQVVWYQKGQHFLPHCDWIPRDHLDKVYNQQLDSGEKPLKGQRLVTFFVYLNHEGLEGGDTYFPVLNITVRPKKGSALMWYNMREDGTEDERTLHQGRTVFDGDKWGINIWQRIPL